MKLIGDVGGTKTLLALVDEAGQIREKRRLASADFHAFEELLAAFLGDVSAPIEGGCLVVAGPVADDGRRAKITNLPWIIDAEALERRFGLTGLRLANDFVGVAVGAVRSTPAERLVLQAGVPKPEGVKLVLGAGTGLGMAIVCHGRVLASEGGHVAFAPQDEDELRLWQALAAEHGRVTAERVISGPGLANIHRLLAAETCDPAEIVARARQGNAAARRTLEVFFQAYGAFAGDMALAVLATGGVFLAGGVTQHLLPELAASGFLAAFNAKAEHAALMTRMPVEALTDAEIGLKGAAHLAVGTTID
ncbi:MAG: glucokinase [Rhodocyclaceae bacterium]|nr:glucokinase [Rhodocyclaceae bacterium]